MPLEMEVGNAKFLGTCCWLPPHQLLDETEGARLSSLLLTLAHDNRICWVIMPETVATLAKGGGGQAGKLSSPSHQKHIRLSAVHFFCSV